MSEITDKERLDFLDAQVNWTRWMGYDKGETGSCIWPICSVGSKSFRDEVDIAIKIIEKGQ